MEVGTAIFSWLAIAFCLSQSALFSGLNLAAFGISRLRLEADAASGHAEASILLHLRQDSNFLLTTIIWGNVSVNVLLTLVSKSVMSGVLAFFFSAVVITIFGEIVPQAYFVRHASRVVSRLAPLLRIYQKLLYPVAKPTAMLLDRWLGPEGVQYWREESLERFLRAHAHAEEADDIHAIEGVGAANFLSLDDIPLGEEGEEVDPASIIQLPFEGELPVFPAVVAGDAESALIQSIQSSGKKWVVITDESREPVVVLSPADSGHRRRAASGQRIGPTPGAADGSRGRRGGSRHHSAVGVSTPGNHGSRPSRAAFAWHRCCRTGAERRGDLTIGGPL
jgi:hypothetical protein